MKKMRSALIVFVTLLLSLTVFSFAEEKEYTRVEINNDNVYEFLEGRGDSSVPQLFSSNAEANVNYMTDLTPTQAMYNYVLSENEKCNTEITLDEYDLQFASKSDVGKFAAKFYYNEELFWASSLSYSYYEIRIDNVVEGYGLGGLYFTYYMTPAQVTEAKAKIKIELDKYLDGIQSDWDELGIAMYTNNYLGNICEYDSKQAETSHNMYAALVVRKPVCDGYSKAFKYLTKHVKTSKVNKFECEMVTSSDIAHAWNEVKVNGKWYHIDSTWDDTYLGTSRNGFTTYKYFMCSDDMFLNNSDRKHVTNLGLKTWEAPYQCTSTDYDLSAIWQDTVFKTRYASINSNWYYATYVDESNVKIDQVDLINNKIIESNTYWVENDGVYPFNSLTNDNDSILYLTSNNYIYKYNPEEDFFDRAYELPFRGDNEYIAFAAYHDGYVYYDKFTSSTVTSSASAGVNAYTYTVDKYSPVREYAFDIPLTTFYDEFYEEYVVGRYLKYNELYDDIFKVKYSPDDADLVEEMYGFSSDPYFVTREGLKWRTSKYGHALVTASTYDGHNDAYVLFVINDDEIRGISFDESEHIGKIGDKFRPEVVVDSDDLEVVEDVPHFVKWKSSNEKVATVDEFGNVEIVGIGEAEISATYVALNKTSVNYGADDLSKGYEFETVLIVKSNDEITDLKLDKNTVEIEVDETHQIVAAVVPSENVDDTLTYESEDDTIATVSSTGLITGISEGETKVKVTTVNGISKDINVTVKAKKVYVTTITIDTEIFNLRKGETKQLNATVLPDNATDNTITWSSSNENVATVDQDGVVTAVGKGIAKIRATANDGSNVYAESSVGVIVPLEGISVEDIELAYGIENYEIDVIYNPEDVTDSYKGYKVELIDGEEYVSVNEDNTLNGLEKGVANIRVTSTYDETIFVDVKVTVKVLPTSITLDATEKNILLTQTSKYIVATVLPDDEDVDKTVTWSSSNPEIVTIDNTGKLTPKSLGSSVITARTVNGLEAYCTVNVVAVVTNVNVTPKTLSLGKEEQAQLEYEILPSNVSDKTVTWYSENEAVATVDENGLVTAIAGGDTRIVAQSNSNPVKKGYCDLSVVVPATSIKINLEEDILKLSPNVTSYNITATLGPEDQTSICTWTSSDTSVATIGGLGTTNNINTAVIRPVSVGTTTIKVETDNGLSDEITLRIFPLVKSVSFDVKSLILEKDEEYNLVMTYSPEDIESDFVWESSDNSVATIDETGKIVAVSEGECDITCTAESGAKATCKVTVVDEFKYLSYESHMIGDEYYIELPDRITFDSIDNSEVFLYKDKGFTYTLENSDTTYIGTTAQIVVRDKSDNVKRTFNVMVKGDLNNDGRVRLNDSFVILRRVLKSLKFEGVELIAADFNDDGKVALLDAFGFLRQALKS